MNKNKNNRKCIICGKEYSYCPVCGKDVKKPSWYTIFCSDNCNSIYEAVTTFRDGGCTVEAARDLLNGLDLKAVDNDEFNATTRKQIKDILSFNEKKDEVVEPVAEEVVEEKVEAVEPVVEEVKEVVKEKKEEKKSFNGSNQSFKKNNYNNFRK